VRRHHVARACDLIRRRKLHLLCHNVACNEGEHSALVNAARHLAVIRVIFNSLVVPYVVAKKSPVAVATVAALADGGTGTGIGGGSSRSISATATAWRRGRLSIGRLVVAVVVSAHHALDSTAATAVGTGDD